MEKCYCGRKNKEKNNSSPQRMRYMMYVCAFKYSCTCYEGLIYWINEVGPC